MQNKQRQCEAPDDPEAQRLTAGTAGFHSGTDRFSQHHEQDEARPQERSGALAVQQAVPKHNQADLIDRLARVYKLFWEAGVRDGLVSPLSEDDTKGGRAG